MKNKVLKENVFFEIKHGKLPLIWQKKLDITTSNLNKIFFSSVLIYD